MTAVTHRGRGHAKAAVAGIAVAFAAAVILGAGVSVGGLGEIVLTVVFVAFFAVGVATLTLMLFAWGEPDRVQRVRFSEPNAEPYHSFSLILPARHEEGVLPATIAGLRRQHYPHFEVIVVIGDDDPVTHAAARVAIGGDRRFRIVVDSQTPKTKPKALNTALPYCQGDIVGVFDAEDIVAGELLLAVDHRFRETGAEVVQGATQLMNFDTTWFTGRNVLEYYFWFRSRLHFHAMCGFIPLGGNTVFVRHEWLNAVGGWDADCLAEDCDLGSRLSTLGARTVVAYSPDLVTREETPDTVRALHKQRTRWNQGYLQVLRKGDWKTLPLLGRTLAVVTLAFPFFQAAVAILLPLLILVALFAHLPLPLTMVGFAPIIPLVAILIVELVGLAEFGRDFGATIRVRDYLRLIWGAIPYQLLLASAALHAAVREIRGINNWEKTAHVGAHL